MLSFLPENVLQDNLGVSVDWDLGVSPSQPLQRLWSGGLLHFQHVSGDFALCAGGEAQPPNLEQEPGNSQQAAWSFKNVSVTLISPLCCRE